MNFKKITALVLCALILIGSCTVFALDSKVTEDYSQSYVKIGILYGSTAPSEVTLESENGFFIADISDEGWKLNRDLSEYTSLKVVNNNESIIVSSEDGSFSRVLTSDEGIMAAGPDLDDMYITINGTKYRDGAAFNCADGGNLIVMSYVSVEHYLWGVVSSEMSYKKPLEALKTMAVCARSFVYAGSGKHTNYGFDLCNTSCCQVYKPVNLEYDSIIQACQETKNMVITYNNKVVIGYYFAYSSGHTLNSEDVWVAAVPYARGVEDEYSSKYNWSFIYTFDQISEILEKRGIYLGEIQKVSISSTGSYGAVTGILVEGTEGSKEFTKSTMKSVFSLKSQTFTITGYDPNDEDGNSAVQEDYICVMGADGTTVKMNPSDLYITNGDSAVSGADLSWDGNTQSAENGYSTSGYVYFSGSGYGHGVGVAQTGAQNMANKGMTYIDILNYYFTGIEVKEYERQ